MNDITPLQRDLLVGLQRLTGFWVEWDDERGVAELIRGAALGRVVDDDRPIAALGKNAALFGPEPPAFEHRLLQDRWERTKKRHVVYQQTLRHENENVDLYGAQLAIHIEPDGLISTVQSSCYREPSFERFTPLSREKLRSMLLASVSKAGNLNRLPTDSGQFPIVKDPRLVVYPWRGVFTPVFVVHAFAIPDGSDPNGGAYAEVARIFVEATSGERLLFASLTRDAGGTAHTGHGLGVTPLAGPFTRHQLKAQALADGSFVLVDGTREREIRTYDAGNSRRYDYSYEVGSGLRSGQLSLSSDPDADWDGVLKKPSQGMTMNQRRANRANSRAAGGRPAPVAG